MEQKINCIPENSQTLCSQCWTTGCFSCWNNDRRITCWELKSVNSCEDICEKKCVYVANIIKWKHIDATANINKCGKDVILDVERPNIIWDDCIDVKFWTVTDWTFSTDTEWDTFKLSLKCKDDKFVAVAPLDTSWYLKDKVRSCDNTKLTITEIIPNPLAPNDKILEFCPIFNDKDEKVAWASDCPADYLWNILSFWDCLINTWTACQRKYELNPCCFKRPWARKGIDLEEMLCKCPWIWADYTCSEHADCCLPWTWSGTAPIDSWWVTFSWEMIFCTTDIDTLSSQSNWRFTNSTFDKYTSNFWISMDWWKNDTFILNWDWSNIMKWSALRIPCDWYWRISRWWNIAFNWWVHSINLQVFADLWWIQKQLLVADIWETEWKPLRNDPIATWIFNEYWSLYEHEWYRSQVFFLEKDTLIYAWWRLDTYVDAPWSWTWLKWKVLFRNKVNFFWNWWNSVETKEWPSQNLNFIEAERISDKDWNLLYSCPCDADTINDDCTSCKAWSI